MVKFLIIIVTEDTPRHRMNDTIMQVTLNTINGVLHVL